MSKLGAEPSVKQAEDESSSEMYHNGAAGVFSTTLPQLGTMGVGVQLYFSLLKSLTIIFVLMSLCHLPAFIFNSQGNDNNALMKTKQNIWTVLSLANQGFDRDLVAFDGCRKDRGPVDCR